MVENLGRENNSFGVDSLTSMVSQVRPGKNIPMDLHKGTIKNLGAGKIGKALYHLFLLSLMKITKSQELTMQLDSYKSQVYPNFGEDYITSQSHDLYAISLDCKNLAAGTNPHILR